MVHEGTQRAEGGMVSGAAQIVLSAQSQLDLTVTVKEAEGTHLRLDDVDLHALQASNVDLVVEVSDVPHDDSAFPRFQKAAGSDAEERASPPSSQRE